MILSCERLELSLLNESELREAMRERRRVIREHRDMRGDDRCWLDDYVVWAMLDDSPPAPSALPAFEAGMEKCRQFFRDRNAEAADPAPTGAIVDPARWDDDLQNTTPAQLLDELVRVQEAIRRHRDIAGRPRTAEDDRALYGVLPEKVPADFRLPPEEAFLGEARSPQAGCPAFWRSHSACATSRHNLHRWGPCT